MIWVKVIVVALCIGTIFLTREYLASRPPTLLRKSNNALNISNNNKNAYNSNANDGVDNSNSINSAVSGPSVGKINPIHPITSMDPVTPVSALPPSGAVPPDVSAASREVEDPKEKQASVEEKQTGLVSKPLEEKRFYSLEVDKNAKILLKPPDATPDSHIFGTLLGPASVVMEGDEFTLENVVVENPDANWNSTFAEVIGNYNDEKKCPDASQSEMEEFAKKGLQLWKDIAVAEKIPYMLAFGSLLGYARDKSFITNDNDVDVFVPPWAYERLKKYATGLPINADLIEGRAFLFLQAEYPFTRGTKRKTFDCDGTIIESSSSISGCGFVTPIARLYIGFIFVDIFAAHHLPHVTYKEGGVRASPWGVGSHAAPASQTPPQGKIKGIFVLDENHLLTITDPNRFLPRRPCTFLGIQVWCPNDYRSILLSYFGPTVFKLRPLAVCNPESREFEDREANKELHSRLDNEWRKKWDIEETGTSDVASSNEVFCQSLESPLDIFVYSMCR